MRRVIGLVVVAVVLAGCSSSKTEVAPPMPITRATSAAPIGATLTDSPLSVTLTQFQGSTAQLTIKNVSWQPVIDNPVIEARLIEDLGNGRQTDLEAVSSSFTATTLGPGQTYSGSVTFQTGTPSVLQFDPIAGGDDRWALP